MTDWMIKSDLIYDLHTLGVAPGDTLMVHSSMRAVGKVLGGVNTMLEALLDTLRPQGTLMMYAGWNDDGYYMDEWAADEQRLFAEHGPVFDPATAHAVRDHGVLVETFRTWPGTLRSANPTANIIANGVGAATLLADHPLRYGYGAGSPFEKLIQCGGKVLALGSPLERLTLLHYSEHVANLPDKHIVRYRCPILINAEKTWFDMEEFDTGDGVIDAPYLFSDIAQDYLATGAGAKGKIGNAESVLFDAAGLAAFGVRWLEERFGTPQVRSAGG